MVRSLVSTTVMATFAAACVLGSREVPHTPRRAAAIPMVRAGAYENEAPPVPLRFDVEHVDVVVEGGAVEEQIQDLRARVVDDLAAMLPPMHAAPTAKVSIRIAVLGAYHVSVVVVAVTSLPDGRSVRTEYEERVAEENHTHGGEWSPGATRLVARVPASAERAVLDEAMKRHAAAIRAALTTRAADRTGP